MDLKMRLWAVGCALWAASGLGAQGVGLDVGAAAPAAKVETLDGKPADLSAYIGKAPVLMEFWATWCENCHELEPSMKALQAKYGKRVRFVGVAVSVNQSVPRIKAYVAKHALVWDQLYDAKGVAADVYDAPATSYVVIVDRAGKVVYTGVGGRQNLEPAIVKAMR